MKWKKATATLLAISMVLTIPLGVSAAETASSSTATQTDQTTPTISTTQSTYTNNDYVRINYTGAQNTHDWISVTNNPNSAENPAIWCYLDGDYSVPDTLQANGSTVISTYSLAPGTYYVYFCKNDTHEYYAKTSFTVTAPSISLSKSVCTQGEKISAKFNGAKNTKDWICVNKNPYQAGDSIIWTYLDNDQTAPSSIISEGSVVINTATLAPGTYYVYYCKNDSYSYYDKATLVVEKASTVSVDKASYTAGETVVATVKGARAVTDWVGINQTPNAAGSSIQWKYVNNSQSVPATLTEDGTVTFDTSSLENGTYYVYFCKSDGYTYYSSTSFTVTGSSYIFPKISTDKTSYKIGDTITVNFRGANDAWDMITLKNKATGQAKSYFCDGTTGPTAENPQDPMRVRIGSVSFQTSSLPAGTYDVYLSYMGNTSYLASTTITITQ